MTNHSREKLMEGLEELELDDIREINSLMEGGVEPESDEEMEIKMLFTESGQRKEPCDRTEILSVWKDQFSFALGLMLECQLALNEKLEEEENNIRDLPEYRKAMTFLNVAAGSNRWPDWNNLETSLRDYGFDDDIIELAIKDAKKKDDPEYSDSW